MRKGGSVEETGQPTIPGHRTRSNTDSQRSRQPPDIRRNTFETPSKQPGESYKNEGSMGSRMVTSADVERISPGLVDFFALRQQVRNWLLCLFFFLLEHEINRNHENGIKQFHSLNNKILAKYGNFILALRFKIDLFFDFFMWAWFETNRVLQKNLTGLYGCCRNPPGDQQPPEYIVPEFARGTSVEENYLPIDMDNAYFPCDYMWVFLWPKPILLQFSDTVIIIPASLLYQSFCCNYINSFLSEPFSEIFVVFK